MEVVNDDDAPAQDEKSIVFAMGGALLAGFVVDATLVEGSGVAQASLEPQGSALERLANAFCWEVVEVAAFGGPWEVKAGLDRLNAELMLDEVVGAAFGFVSCRVVSVKSKRLKLEVDVGFG